MRAWSHRGRKLGWLLVLALQGCAACPQQELCTTEAVPGVVVRVREPGSQGAAICDAMVRIQSDDGHDETVTAVPGEDCFYSGAAERPGTYAITASRTGYRSTTVENVTVMLGDCHVETEERTLVLERL